MGILTVVLPLGVVYEVSLEVVLVTHAGCTGVVGIAIWRVRLFGESV